MQPERNFQNGYFWINLLAILLAPSSQLSFKTDASKIYFKSFGNFAKDSYFFQIP